MVKKPSFSPTSADACVILVRKPSLTVTGALPPELVLAAAVVPDEADVDEEEEQAAASRAVAPIIAAAVTRRI